MADVQKENEPSNNNTFLGKARVKRGKGTTLKWEPGKKETFFQINQMKCLGPKVIEMHIDMSDNTNKKEPFQQRGDL